MLKYLHVGKVAPNFLTVGVFKNKLGKVRLSDYRGKKYVILMFYPANFTIMSTNELIQLDKYTIEFQKLSSQILAISIDSPFSHLQFLKDAKNQNKLTSFEYPLICDLTQNISNKYRLLTNDGLCLPGAVIIDKNGVIQYYTVNNLLCGRNISEILRILRTIQFLKENPSQGSLSDWGIYI